MPGVDSMYPDVVGAPCGEGAERFDRDLQAVAEAPRSPPGRGRPGTPANPDVRSRRPGRIGGTASALECPYSTTEGDLRMYNILYIIGAIVVIIVVLRLLGLY
jgi:hypothetical protein